MFNKPKKTVLVSLCASYSHTPLALYALKAYCAEFEDYIFIETFTINQPDDVILRCLYEHKPEMLGFSCYIWNMEKTVRIAAAIRVLLPDTLIIFGGPEVAEEYDSYLKNKIADIVIPGEGEAAFLALMRDEAIFEIEGVVSAETLPFPYDSFKGLENKALYYEASRGCPFSCGYCLSAGTSLRLKPLDKVLEELTVFVNARVMRVKFIDRTFNANEDFAMAIWRFLMENDNGVSNFHFEIAADLLSEAALDLLREARPGLFQFEIGVQSTNPKTLAIINRKTDIKRLSHYITALRKNNNIHLHLDLIAGLPGEDVLSFKESFNHVYQLNPHHLQIGFLKLLKGTPLRKNAEKLGLKYNAHPPYEILSTPVLSYDDLILLKSIAEMVEVFYNSGKFTHTLIYLLCSMGLPAFELYEKLADFWKRESLADKPHGKIRIYKAMYDFAKAYTQEEIVLKELLRFDLLVNENEKSVPEWLLTGRKRECFKTDILLWLEDVSQPVTMREVTLVFDYPAPGRQDPMTVYERIKKFES